MNLFRILAASTIAWLGVGAPAFAQTSGPQRPSMPIVPINTSPACGTVTLEQCSDPEFLYESRCGAQQRNRSDSLCAELLHEAMGEAAERDGEELSVVPPNITPSGVDYVVPSRPSPQGRYYVPDLLSQHSGQAASAYVDNDVIGVNEYDLWVSNGTQVSSCREYVWERYADVNEFLRDAGPVRNDFRAVFDIAFGPASDRSSIGTRHLNNANLRGRDGRVFGQIFAGAHRLRNVFHGLVDFPGYSTEFPPPTDVPGLLVSISARSLTGAMLVGRLQAARAANTHRVSETWAWHRQMSQRFAWIPSANFLGPQQLAGFEQERGAFDLAALGNSPAPNHRRYLDAELDELWRLQQRALGLVDAWKSANLQFAGSGWNVRDAGLGYPPIVIGNVGRFINDIAAPQRRTRPPGPVQGPSQIAIPDPETVVRQRILDELIEVLTLANQYRCLEGGDSPCDWSTARFAEVLQNDFGARQDTALEWCNEFTAGNLQNVLNLDYAFVDDPDFPEYACSVQTGNTITGLGLEQLEADVEYCRQMQNEYAFARAQQEAQARVREIPELVDPASGEFVMPGIQRSRDELMGNEYFGLAYNYELGFSSDINAEICQVDVRAVALAKASARVFGQEIILLDVGAEADTVERSVDIWARVASKNIFVPQELFDPISIDVAEIEPLEWNLTRTFEKSKEQKIIETTIIIVVVPLSLEAGIAGRVGAELGLSVYAEAADNNGCPRVDVGGIARPFLGVDGYVEAALDVFIAEVGIRGDLNIIEVSLPFRPSLGVVAEQLSLDPADFSLSVRARLDVALSTLSGKLAAYAEVGFCPLCYVGRFELVDWAGPSWNTNLFDHEYTLTLADLFAAFGG